MTQTEITTLIIVKEWVCCIENDIIEYRVLVRRECIDGYYEDEIITGGNILNMTIESIQADLEKRFNCEVWA